MAFGRKTRKSLLFTLPPELRNVIYDLVLTGPWQTIRLPFSRPALLKVCRQITSEASPIFFNLHDFYASLTTADIMTFTRCLKAMGSHGAKALRHLTLCLDIELEAAAQRTSKYGGGGVLSYPHWWWSDVPRAISNAGVRPKVVAIVPPYAAAWTGDLCTYAGRWMDDLQKGLPGSRKEDDIDESSESWQSY